MPRPLIQLRPRAAAIRGIQKGYGVNITTPTGQFAARAELTSSIRSDATCAQCGWWDAVSGSSGLVVRNSVIDAAIIERASGSNRMCSYMCQVAPAT